MNYTESDLVRIAKRENNTKRGYLVVNPIQGKHVPVSPTKSLLLFKKLADIIKETYTDEAILFIGFAETATAIGAQVSITVGGRYIQTTREIIPNVNYLFFSEEHSHATEQKLVKDDIDAVIDKIDRIIFVEDEVTTGKTILNIITILEKMYPNKVRFSVASILNGMNGENLDKYEKKNISLHYLVKTDHSEFDDIAGKYKGDGIYYEADETDEVKYLTINIDGKVNARRLVDSDSFQKGCQKLFDEVHKSFKVENKKILVIGTEETMFPALYIGSCLENRGNTVYSHSTTRSPIEVSTEQEYPLHRRYQLKSLYDESRKTFIYDIGKYDEVLIVTDAPESEYAGLKTLLNAISKSNSNITLIRWC